jgi:hypothetical protein
MNSNIKPNPDTKTEAIDRILSADEQLVPSSGFLSGVMELVHEEAAAPPPIPFPWKRALPGFILAAGVFGWSAFDLFRYLPQAVEQIPSAATHLSVAVTRDLTQAGWVALACVLSLLSWWLSRRLTQRSGLL